jgi:hypothetical protein
LERRAGQRFGYNLPVSLRDLSSGAEGLGFTQDISSRGVFFFTDMPVAEGDEIEVTLMMPSEITLGESMRVRCRAQVLRLAKPSDSAIGTEGRASETKIGVAVCLQGYEYLPEEEDFPATFRRIAALHAHLDDAPLAEPCSLSPRIAAH